MREIEIHPAHFWACDHCGRDNFERGMTLTVEYLKNSEDYETYCDFCEALGTYDPIIHDQPPDGMAMTAPEYVKCYYCGAEFRTVDSRADN